MIYIFELAIIASHLFLIIPDLGSPPNNDRHSILEDRALKITDTTWERRTMLHFADLLNQ